jgi:uncharacterized protein
MKKALVCWGGWDGHEPRQTTEVFLPFLASQGYDVRVEDNMAAYADEEYMKSVDLIVPCFTMAGIEGPQEQGLLSAVRNGAGIAGWHGGMGDSFRNNTGYQFMVGGQFVDHPGGIIKYTVNVSAPNDPLMAGISAFEMNSEQDYMHVDPCNEVLATSTFTAEHCPWIGGCVMPQVWKRPYGQGRVFYSALGHVATDFDIPEVKLIMERGMLWASR